MMQPTTASERKWLNSLYTGEIREMIARQKNKITTAKSKGRTERELIPLYDELEALREELSSRKSE